MGGSYVTIGIAEDYAPVAKSLYQYSMILIPYQFPFFSTQPWQWRVL